jgi:glycosyltransferase involved in cell wall biosynthesis
MIHNSIDVLEVRNHLLAREEGRRQLGVGPEDFVYGTVGRLVPEKGHALLLTAFARMASPYSRSRLVIIGDGPLASELLRHAQRLGVERRVVFAGFKENAAMLMSAFDVFVLSSRRLPGLAGEGLPRVLLEAMAAGIPIVATDVGGVREAVGSTAICMPDDDAGKLASALSRMADMPRERRDEMAAAARLRVESEFRSDHFRHQIQEWVHRVFAESKL